MSETVQPPELPAPARVHVQREHVFQAMVDRFLDRVVLPPFWCSGINHENELTDNARSRARGRGVKAGVFDLYVCQAPALHCWIECKWGKNKPSDAQEAVAEALWNCGVPHGYAWSVHDVLRVLRAAGMKLHGNADNIAIEYQARAEAAVANAEAKAASKRTGAYKPSKPRARKPTMAQVRRSEAARVLPR